MKLKDSGLLPEKKEVFNDNKREYEIVDCEGNTLIEQISNVELKLEEHKIRRILANNFCEDCKGTKCDNYREAKCGNIDKTINKLVSAFDSGELIKGE